MTTKSSSIEVYEWPIGAPRPRTKFKEPCLEIFAVPPDAQLPQQGDVVLFDNPSDPMIVTRYRVVERELAWYRGPNDPADQPAKWTKMWIHVRRLDDPTQ